MKATVNIKHAGLIILQNQQILYLCMSVKVVCFVCGKGIKAKLDINHEIVIIIFPPFPFSAQVH